VNHNINWFAERPAFFSGALASNNDSLLFLNHRDRKTPSDIVTLKITSPNVIARVTLSSAASFAITFFRCGITCLRANISKILYYSFCNSGGFAGQACVQSMTQKLGT
jgi:hypothetical protein